MKHKNAGRATFCILQKQQHLQQQCNKQLQTPENVPRLFDLIKPVHEMFRVAFYQVLKGKNKQQYNNTTIQYNM
jgi:structural maintenance of chromosome 4